MLVSFPRIANLNKVCSVQLKLISLSNESFFNILDSETAAILKLLFFD